MRSCARPLSIGGTGRSQFTCSPSPSSAPLARVSCTDERSRRRRHAEVHVTVASDADRDVGHEPAARTAADALRPQPPEIGKVHLIQIGRQIGTDPVGPALPRTTHLDMGDRTAVTATQAHPQCLHSNRVHRARRDQRRIEEWHVAGANPHRAGAGVQPQTRIAQRQAGIEIDRDLAADRRIQRRQGRQRRRCTRYHSGCHRRQPGAQMRLAGARRQHGRQRQSRPLLAKGQAQLGGALDAALRPTSQVDLRTRRPPRDAELPIHYRDLPIVDAHAAQLPQQRIRSQCPITAGRTRQLGQQIGEAASPPPLGSPLSCQAPEIEVEPSRRSPAPG